MPEQFDAPIPGESLTSAPGGMPWEKPAQFSDPEAAVEEMLKRLAPGTKLFDQAIKFMDAGVAAEALAKMVTFSGFTEGLWTPDVAELIKGPLTVYMVHIANAAGIDPVVDMDDGEDEKRQGEEDVYNIRKRMEARHPKEEIMPKGPPMPPMEEAPMMEEPPMVEAEAPAPQGMGGFMDMAGGNV
jgi:hypothetical protein